MRYYSTSNKNQLVSLREATLKGIAPDGGLYMPEAVPHLPKAFIKNIAGMTLQDIGYAIANYALQGDVEAGALHDIINETLNFDMPLVYLSDNRYILELFHGPTMAFKDVGARFMARLVQYFNKQDPSRKALNVLVATSGDSGSAIANGFLNVPGVNVYVLFPQGRLNDLQEAQFATLGHNVKALAVNGTFDDCKELVDRAYMDEELNGAMRLTSATSINVARIISQMSYYFYAYAQLAQRGEQLDNIVVAVPCANLGNLVSGLMARAMGLPIKRFVSAENQNNIFYTYLKTGKFTPKPSIPSLAPALDAGNPNNFARVMDLCGTYDEVCRFIHGYCCDDNDIADTMLRTFHDEAYQLDPQGAVAYRALCQDLQPGEVGIALETAHPAKFKDSVEHIMGHSITVPEQLNAFLSHKRAVINIPSGFTAFKNYLLEQKKENDNQFYM